MISYLRQETVGEMKSHPLSSTGWQTGRGVLLCSAGLNLLLLAAVLGLAKIHLAKPPPPPACTVAGSEVSPVPEAASWSWTTS